MSENLRASLFFSLVIAAIPVAGQDDKPALIQCIENAKTIAININGTTLLKYNKVPLRAPDGIDKSYERTGYIHPVKTPSGVIVTGDFPADHAHQHAMFSAWTNTTYKGRRVDFWNQPKGKGIVAYSNNTSSTTTDENHAEFTVQQNHQVLGLADEPVTVLKESWTLSANRKDNQPGQTYYVYDLSLSQTNITDQPLIMNRYHYGGLGLRGNNQWFTDEGNRLLKKLKPDVDGNVQYPPLTTTRHRFLTSEGKRRLAGNHSRPTWVDLSGIVNDKSVGIAVMGHPSNFRHPQPVRLHPSKPYFCFAACVIGEFSIDPGKTYSARFRYIVHDGEPNAELLDQLYEQHAKLP